MLRKIIIAIIFMNSGGLALASPQTFYFQGLADTYANFSGNYVTPFTGNFTYDWDLSGPRDISTSDPNFAGYTPTWGSLSLTFNGSTIMTPVQWVFVGYHYGGGGYNMFDYFAVQPSGAVELRFDQFVQAGVTDFVSSKEFPTSFPFQDNFEQNNVNTQITFSGMVGKITYLSSTAPVPETDTSVMLLMGLGLFGFIAWKRNV